MTNIISKHTITQEIPPKLEAIQSWSQERKYECGRINCAGLEALFEALEQINLLPQNICKGVEMEIKGLDDTIVDYCLLVDRPQQMIQRLIEHFLQQASESIPQHELEPVLLLLASALIRSQQIDQMLTPGGCMRDPIAQAVDLDEDAAAKHQWRIVHQFN